MRIVLTRSFERDFIDLPVRLKEDVQRTAKRLVADHRHPSLRAKKMQPRSSGIFEVRVSGSHRMTFRVDGDKIVLRRVGNHDILRKP